MSGATTILSMPARRWRARASILAAFLLLTVSSGALAPQAGVPKPGIPKAQKHEKRHEIDQLEDQWCQAVLKSNTTAMQNLLADDYLAITASGTLQTKEQALDNLRSGRTRFTRLEISDRKVRFYGTTALVTSVAEVQGVTGNGELAGSYRYTRVYVRDAQGAWKIVSFEASRIREPAEGKEHK